MTFSRFISATIISGLCLSFSSFAAAEAAVWKVSKGGNTLYLAGTFHLLSEEDHPLPTEYDRAYAAASEIIFETDMEAAGKPEFQMQAAQAMISTKGPLKSVLSPSTYQALDTFLQGRGLPIDQLAPFSPAGVALTIVALEYQRLGMRPELGVDQTYFDKAKQDGKAIGQLETLQEQLDVIAGMGRDNEDEMIEYTLRDLNNIQAYMADLRKYWRAGDMEELDDYSLKEMREDFNETYQSMLVNRNNNWLPKIEAMLSDSNIEAVFVGALHMAGEDGLVVQLQQRGYRVEKL